MFGLKIYKKNRIEKVLQLLKGNKEDILIACTLLGSKENIEPPKFKIAVEKDRMYLWFKEKNGNWTIMSSQHGDYTNESIRNKGIDIFKKQMEQPPFEKFEIFY